MIELSKEDIIKYKLYNLSLYIRSLNVFHFLLFIYNFILSLKNNNLEQIFFNSLHLFVITPIMFFSIKYYVLYFVIISEVYKTIFCIFKLFEFYRVYTLLDMTIVLIDMYIIYFNIKYIHFNYQTSKNIIYELSDGWKPSQNIFYLY